MVVDSSVLIAILLAEPEAEDFANRLITADEIYLSAVTIFESAMVIECKKGEQGAIQFDALVAEITPTVVAFDAQQAEFARAAWRQRSTSCKIKFRRLLQLCRCQIAQYAAFV